MAAAILPDYFAFFELPVALEVDQAVVRRKYLENSRKFHPDFHTKASEEAQDIALEWSSLNNEAFNTLSDPDKLLRYVLQLKGMLAEEGAENRLPPTFLMEMMEVNEKIMELEFDPTPTLFQSITNDVTALESSIEESFDPASRAWKEVDGNPQALQNAKEYFLKKRYLLRIKENLSKFASAFEK